ncbi:metallophosphoesterase family protein [Salisediminibacterium halotolerans]|uniref:DNA repair exonuclease SbcCD nuclease subunit n=1 Tax=Salisediminibacterium halotolerans TaxID=517425 RepID=A0A1H9THG5_9BACI|nr:DNA repair exonuclease [Salisediminibacterium haloalkalitolerans]SER96591.1 DNA repair exonuclease SbcCD nuclease subunit [Salisediminibacterium haloalkalitolerans]
MITFIHMADLHLGRVFQTNVTNDNHAGKKALDAVYRSLDNAVQTAIDQQVDFIVIAGDIYDEAERSVKGKFKFQQACSRLQEYGIHVYAVHGNHDPLTSSVSSSADLPANVTVFSAEGETVVHTGKSGEKAALSGFSYPQTVFTESPIARFPARSNNDYHIGILHGQEGTLDGHEPYAPFRARELAALEYDYWALGHIHDRQVLQADPPIRYSGCIQGANRKEQGPKGVDVVRLDSSGAHCTFVQTAPIVWAEVTVGAEDVTTEAELISKADTLTAERFGAETAVFTITVTGETALHEQLSDIDKKYEWIELLREELSSDGRWVDQVRVQTKPVIDREVWRNEDHLYGDIIRIREEITEADKTEIIDAWRKNAKLRRVMRETETWSEKEWEAVWDEAEQLILANLIDEERGL